MRFRLIIFLAFFLSGCIGQTTYWTDWLDWQDWKQTKKTKAQPLKVTSEPSQSRVYIDGIFMGVTPLAGHAKYPLLESERFKYQYKQTNYNTSLNWMLFRRGDRPGRTVRINSQREAKNKPKDIPHKIEVKREGYRPSYKTISLGENSAHLVLQEKPCLIFNIEIDNRSELSFAQALHDFIFTDKFSKKIKPKALKRLFLSNPNFRDTFKFSKKDDSCNKLNCKMAVENEYTQLNISLSDEKNSEISGRTYRFKTGYETDEFLSELKNRISQESARIYRILCGE